MIGERCATTILITLHPNGRTIAYRAGQNRGEIWVLDGIAAAEKPPR